MFDDAIKASLILLIILIARPVKSDGGTADILFVLDGSGSISPGKFDNVKNWVKNITKIFEPWMKSGEVQIGVVQYSHYYRNTPIKQQRFIKTEIKLGQYKSYGEFKEAVDGIVHHRYTTYTGRALEKVETDFRGSYRFGVEGNRQVMLLLTGGESVDSDLLQANADRLRSINVTTYAVGVGKTDKDELLKIAGSSSRIYSTEGLGQFESLVEQLQKTVVEFLPHISTTVGTQTTSRWNTSPNSGSTSKATTRTCKTAGLSTVASVAIGTCIGIIVGFIASSAVWWWMLNFSSKDPLSGETELNAFKPTHLDSQSLESEYEVVGRGSLDGDGRVVSHPQIHDNCAYEVIV